MRLRLGDPWYKNEIAHFLRLVQSIAHFLRLPSNCGQNCPPCYEVPTVAAPADTKSSPGACTLGLFGVNFCQLLSGFVRFSPLWGAPELLPQPFPELSGALIPAAVAALDPVGELSTA